MLLLQKIALFAHFLCQAQRPCTEAMCCRLVPGPSASSCCCAHSKHERAQGQVGVLYCGRYVVAYRTCLLHTLAGTSSLQRGWSLSSCPAWIWPFFGWRCFPFPFCFLANVWNALSVCPVLLLAGSLCFRPPSIWVHQAWVSWFCPCRAGWGWGTRGSSRRPLRSTRSHPCPRGSTWLPACRSSHLGEEKWSELMEAMYMTGFLH